MPWSNDNYPNSFKNLEESEGKKAISIANALLKENHDDGSAIRIALSKVKKDKGSRQKTASILPRNNHSLEPLSMHESSLVKVAGDYVRRSRYDR